MHKPQLPIFQRGATMHISKDDLMRAGHGLITPEQGEQLWNKLLGQHTGPVKTKFDAANVAYFFGALVVMSAMGWLMNLGFEKSGGIGIFCIAACYAILFIFAGRRLWFTENQKIPGGLLFTLAVWMTPLAIYGMEQAAGLWPQGAPANFQSYHIWIKGSWVVMEAGTIIAGLVALKFVRFPFLTFPVAFSLWYLSMDLTPLIFRRPEFSWDERLWVSLCFGLLMLLVTFLIDRRTREDYAFWGYLFGVMAFWGGMSLMESRSEWNKFLYCAINIGLIFLAVFLQRRVFVVFGACGVFGYLGYLSYTVFKDSFLSPMALTLLGLTVIFVGVQYQRHRDKIEEVLLAVIPESVRNLRPVAR
jgi:hypothetical protein